MSFSDRVDEKRAELAVARAAAHEVDRELLLPYLEALLATALSLGDSSHFCHVFGGGTPVVQLCEAGDRLFRHSSGTIRPTVATAPCISIMSCERRQNRAAAVLLATLVPQHEAGGVEMELVMGIGPRMGLADGGYEFGEVAEFSLSAKSPSELDTRLDEVLVQFVAERDWVVERIAPVGMQSRFHRSMNRVLAPYGLKLFSAPPVERRF